MEDDREGREKREDRLLLRAEYRKLKDKYALPDFEIISANFELENIDPYSNILREITREMYDTIDFYIRMLDNLIQPDSKLSDMKEAGNLSEEDQDVIGEIYRKCMLLNRELMLTNLDFNESAAAKEIIKTHTEWQNIKKDLKPVFIKMRDTWKQESKKDTQGGYFG